MRKMVYYLGVGLFTFSLVITGTSFVQAEMKGASGYFRPATTGWDAFKASDLLGVQLHTQEMDFLGQISDFVIDPATQRISRIMLSDVAGMGGESVAMPFNSLWKGGENIFAYAAPENVHYFYGERLYWSVGFYWAADVHDVLPYVQLLPPGAEKSSQLMGALVVTPGREDVARINDLVVDSESGHVVYLVLSDVGGVEDKFVAVPFGALTKLRQNIFVVNTTKDQILAAPDFKWPDVTNRKYAEDIYRYYGLQPYWETE